MEPPSPRRLENASGGSLSSLGIVLVFFFVVLSAVGRESPVLWCPGRGVRAGCSASPALPSWSLGISGSFAGHPAPTPMAVRRARPARRPGSGTSRVALGSLPWTSRVFYFLDSRDLLEVVRDFLGRERGGVPRGSSRTLGDPPCGLSLSPKTVI